MLFALLTAALADGPGGQVVVEAPVQPPVLVQQAELSYPVAAQGLHGDVRVRVWIDEHGHVSRVEPVDGPEVFFEEAVAAGYTLLWEPAVQEGQPVPSSAVVLFHFAPPALPPELPHDGHMEVVVEEEQDDELSLRPQTTLREEALAEAAGQDLAGVVVQVPGVTLSEGSANVAKPIIRGATERRLLLLHDGVRHASQKWGPDHAPELDPFSAGSIAVVRGAAAARYGPDAFGGVLLVEPPPLRQEPGVGGRAQVVGATNGPSQAGLRLDARPERSRWSLRAEGSFAKGRALTTPDYVLGNTASQTWTAGAEARWQRDLASLRLAYSHFDMEAGVFYGVQSESPQAFQDQLGASTPVNSELWTRSYDIDRPHQAVTHDQVALHGLLAAGHWTLSGVYAFQINQRQEFEQVRAGVEGPQYDFTLRTHSLDLLAEHEATRLEHAWLQGGVGLQGGFQENVYTGYSLLPNFRAFEGGVFGFERLSGERLEGELGLRMDGLFRAAWMDEQDHGRHLARGNLDGACTDEGARFRCPAAYQSVSASLGGMAHVVPEVLDWKLELTSAGRFPNADELYLIGAAPSFPVYALGDPDLGVERSWGSTSTLGLRSHWIEAELSGYGALIEDYILFAPSVGDDGPDYEVTIRGTWPVFAYQAVDARQLGADGLVDLLPHELVGLRLSAATVHLADRATGEQLVGTPPDTARARLVLRPPDLGPLRDLGAWVEAEGVRQQTRVDAQADFAPAPEGYVLAHAGLALAIAPERGPAWSLGLSGHNLLDARYRSYTSLLRYYADAPGRDLRVRLTAEF